MELPSPLLRSWQVTTIIDEWTDSYRVVAVQECDSPTSFPINFETKQLFNVEQNDERSVATKA